MRRAVGLLFIVIGLAPFAALFAFYWVWARHMYTIGLAVDAKGITALVLIVIADLALLFVGVALLRKPSISN